MLRRRLLSFVCAAMGLTPVSAFAFSGLEQAQSRIDAHLDLEAPVAACANFNGLWRGFCRNTAGELPHNLTITQDGCASLGFGGALLLRFGGMSSAQSTAADQTEAYTMKVDWDDGKREAWYELTKEARGLQAGWKASARVTGRMFYYAGRLYDLSNVSFKAVDPTGKKAEGTDYGYCEYLKVP